MAVFEYAVIVSVRLVTEPARRRHAKCLTVTVGD